MAATGSAQRPLLATSPGLRRRRRRDLMTRSGATLAALLALVILGAVIVTVAIHGASQLSISFLTKNPAQGIGVAAAGGGIANAIVGSALIVALAAAMSVPFGVLIAIFLSEYATRRTARPIRMALDLLIGMPSIILGVFVYGLIVVSHGKQIGWAASLALAVIMTPLIARTTEEMLRLIPRDLRDAAQALGASRWRTILGVVLPGALGGILTGVVLAVARAAGETAPLLLTTSLFDKQSTTLNIFGEAIPNIPVDIFEYSEGLATEKPKAWGAALVLIGLILIGNLTARAVLASQRRRMTRK